MFVEGAYKKIASFFNLKRKTLTTYFSKEIYIMGGSIKGLGPPEEGGGSLAPPLSGNRGAPGAAPAT